LSCVFKEDEIFCFTRTHVNFSTFHATGFFRGYTGTRKPLGAFKDSPVSPAKGYGVAVFGLFKYEDSKIASPRVSTGKQ